jgi:hypothetical protein
MLRLDSIETHMVFFDQFAMPSIDCWVWSLMMSMKVLNARMSSAYFGWYAPAGKNSLMSEMYRRKSIGPNTLPWITPATTLG